MTRLSCKSTDIVVSDAKLDAFEDSVRQMANLQNGEITILADQNVHRLYPDLFDDSCIIIPAGEASKSLVQIETIVLRLLERGVDRSGFILGVGGGVTCDIVGFVASTFMRGVKFGFVPTTLLSMVDASIGGKNGVNIGSFKNMMGTITQPEFIWVNTNFLKTLDRSELVSGMAEIVKHACIESAAHFEFIELNFNAILDLEPSILTKTILDSIAIKANIVEQDERESGTRKLLNYGHTYGHAIEKTKMIPHGFAVSLGMLIANQIAEEHTGFNHKESLRIECLLRKIGLPTEIASIKKETLNLLVRSDKKKTKTHMDFILLNKIGEGTIFPIDLKTL